MKKFLLVLCWTGLSGVVSAQSTFPYNGVNDVREKFYAFTHATVCIDYQTILKDATLVIKEGKIEAVGLNISIPSGAIVVDLHGKFIYPSFIDIYSDYGMPGIARDTNRGIQPPQYDSRKNGAYSWNQAIHPEIHSIELFNINTEEARQWRELGFGTVSTHQQDGIIRGTGSVVMLGDEKPNDLIIKSQSAEYYSFDKGSSNQQYPSSMMGSIALIRQTFYDAQWYQKDGWKEENNISLDELNHSLSLPQIFQVGDVYSILRADRIGDEFNIRFIVKGNGDEYQRIDDLKQAGNELIIPINFPLAYNVEDPYDADLIPLANLLHWELAPENPALLEKAGISFALTASGIHDKKDFWKNLRKAIAYGMSEEQALKSLTFTPAMMMGIYNQVGSIAKGKLANFLICSDSLFSDKNIIYQNWVNGISYVINSYDFKDIRGNYDLKVGNILPTLHLEIAGTIADPESNIMLSEKEKIKVTTEQKDDLFTFSFHYPADTSRTVYRLSGNLFTKNISGNAQNPEGDWITWQATWISPLIDKKDTTNKEIPAIEGKVLYPFTGYGNAELPKQETTLFKNATVWTNEAAGIIQNTDVLIESGKIAQVGKNLSAPSGAAVIDATGKHLTSGIIDEHSHIAIWQGVNEGTQSVTAEVRIGDVVYPNDINIYRNLAGGVTCAHLLHGSANTIGGQTQLIKLRWGYSPEAMKFQSWPGFIKFALGENVKQSNWGDLYNTRFPQTRMGVEQTLFDAFIKARDYKLSWEKYNALSSKEKLSASVPRRDLELDALAEILDGKRYITCHSYVQSEINMLMHVSDSMHFRMNTFTHILEGYKVADKMKAHGVYASNFSDWWSYKFEVYDAIPYNSAILTKVGVVTAVNSDDAEMARRLNQEAGKSIKYGGLSEEDAWKLCTLNPAKMLHVDQWVGSIKVGKDADLVLWNTDPLSIYARCEMTFVDGICFYSIEKDKSKQEWIKQERTRLINKMLMAKQAGEPTQNLNLILNQEYDCDTMTDGHFN